MSGKSPKAANQIAGVSCRRNPCRGLAACRRFSTFSRPHSRREAPPAKMRECAVAGEPIWESRAGRRVVVVAVSCPDTAIGRECARNNQIERSGQSGRAAATPRATESARLV